MIMLNISFLVGKYFSFSKTVGWICVPLVWWHISWCVLEQVRCPLLSSLQPRRNLACPPPGAAHSTGAGDRLVVQCALHTRGANIHNIQRRRLLKWPTACKLNRNLS